ncbi:S41 family peptidase [Aerococcus urinaeequi]|uniref:S41 family peptidase n=1 Tax=Aerococcus urinaeequi TaxID=51665 RepID=UPI001F30D3EF|nr:S41 family peptidase [Aerococcus urinaeequi]
MSENEDLKNKENNKNNKNSNEESDKIAVTEEEIHSSGRDGHELGNDQKPKKRGVSWLVYILTILIVGGGTFVGTSYVLTGRLPGQSVITGSSGTALTTSEIQKIQAAFSTIVGDYVEDVDRDAVVDGAISGMTQVLEDPYSQYLTDQSAQQLDETIEGSFEGIGAEIMEKDDYIQIVSPIKGSPAEEAGLMANDIITAVNGESIQGYTATEAVALIRGEAGSDVVLTIQRGEDTFDVTVTRDTVPIQTVYYEMLEGQDNTGYVQITSFSTPTYDELVAAIEDLRSQGAEKFVLDVRSNPGGLLTSALQIANMFLNDGDTIMQVQEKDADPYVYEASDADYGDFQVDEDVVLLVDEGSASASEILAAALQESAGIPVVGSQTFGKGTVQNVFSLESDSELKITIAKWLTTRWYLDK